jgi:hypothetical protein
MDLGVYNKIERRLHGASPEAGGGQSWGAARERCRRMQRGKGGPSTGRGDVSYAAALETISGDLRSSEGPEPGH